MVIAGELTPRDGAAMLVRGRQSMYEAASDSKYVGDSIGAEAIIGLFYQHDDCGFWTRLFTGRSIAKSWMSFSGSSADQRSNSAAAVERRVMHMAVSLPLVSVYPIVVSLTLAWLNGRGAGVIEGAVGTLV